MSLRFFCVLLSLLLAACTQLQSLVGEGEDRQVLAMIAESQRFAALAAEEQRREVAAATQAFNRERATERNLAPRVRLALLLALPGTAVADDARAAGLLEPLSGTATSAGPLRQFAGLLQAQIAERLREGRRSAQMKEQLDALRSIERTLIERNRPR